ncbi:hypothetical protein A3A49_00790 [Candidatus Curtissbacteria bacterium RIFCSPLOWO2_01_FULL_38_11b]|uniref:YqgF/RNase H-like domain-containing protein n=1 Tax=Candidatus Curtissbacteria bacterium RIFCSPLOWO2_01_FULL_38_11b TaxID=1797725 RepID=A0A1F5GZ30_9BACT|nr:MAG: hypothetical protein A3A49_00790 [Candidatus Curtissbacteria bacterium RIFCSPLOWO2_01_FULL_38_11b]
MILGIDLGQKTTGLAISEGQFASPYKTITHKSQSEAVKKIANIIKELKINTLVLGVVEGKIRSLFQNFTRKIKAKNPSIEIIFWDETLTSRQSRETMIKLNIPKHKRAKKEHEIAANLILQSYLDSQ